MHFILSDYYLIHHLLCAWYFCKTNNFVKINTCFESLHSFILRWLGDERHTKFCVNSRRKMLEEGQLVDMFLTHMEASCLSHFTSRKQKVVKLHTTCLQSQSGEICSVNPISGTNVVTSESSQEINSCHTISAQNTHSDPTYVCVERMQTASAKRHPNRWVLKAPHNWKSSLKCVEIGITESRA